MITHVVRFIKNGDAKGSEQWGVVLDDGIKVLSCTYKTTADLLADRKHVAEEAESNQGERLSLDKIELLSPVTTPCRVICQGVNYQQHKKDSGMGSDKKTFNMFFNKSSASICSAQSPVIKPGHVSLLDYEVELGLVIGKTINCATHITEQNLWEYVAGIVVANDVSARDIQLPEMQFFKGKSYRTFCPVGPYLCLLDQNSMRYLNNLNLELSVNDELRQQDNTRNVTYKPAETLTELSTFSDLDTGDLVLTGTPSGCALRMPSPLVIKCVSLLSEPLRWRLFKKMQKKRKQYLNKGDRIKATIYSDDRMVNLGQQDNEIE